MIHAGRINIGSLYTFEVCGSYWINSIKWLLNTILPLVTATCFPGIKFSTPAGGVPDNFSTKSCIASPVPRIRFIPLERSVSWSKSGLVKTKFDGDIASRICLMINEITRLTWSGRPGTLITECKHQNSMYRNWSAQRRQGYSSQFWLRNRTSPSSPNFPEVMVCIAV